MAKCFQRRQPFGAAHIVLPTTPVRSVRSEDVQAHVCTGATGRRNTIGLGVLCSILVQNDATIAGPPAAVTCYLDIAVDDEPEGRIVIELVDTASVASRRFKDLCIGVQGVGYKRSKIDAIYPDKFIHCAGVRQLSYGEAESPIAGGDSNAALLREMQASKYAHDSAGAVSLQVKPVQDMIESNKLVAEKGRLKRVVERSGVAPNGTQFAISLAPAAELDRTNLIVGYVVEGLSLLRKMSKLPVVKDNSGSVLFKASKAIGDKRADVAELGFNRPFNRVTVLASGVI